MDDLEEDEALPERVPTPPPRKLQRKKMPSKSLSQRAERVHADDDEDFERQRSRRRTCASQVWKLEYIQRRLLKQTAHEFLFYEKNGA